MDWSSVLLIASIIIVVVIVVGRMQFEYLRMKYENQYKDQQSQMAQAEQHG